MRKSELKKLRLKQLDERTTRMRSLLEISNPRGGWIKQIREALGISARQLSARVGISQPTLAKIEKGEVAWTISLKTLDRIAEALECQVIYAFIPRVSFEELVRSRALKASEKLVKRVSHSMDLEKQGLPTKKREAQIREMAEEMARSLSKEIWEDWK